MFAATLTEEQRLHKAIVKLMSEPALLSLSGVMMIGKRAIHETCPTARTDGANEEYGRAFVATLSDPQLRAVILHEVGHKMYRHIATWLHLWKIDAQRANQAADFVVNLWVYDLITKDKVDAQFWTQPAPLLDEAYRGMSVQQVFDLLPPSKGGGKGGAGEPSMDEHDHESAQEMTESEVQELEQAIDAALRQGQMLAGKLGTGGVRGVEELLQSKVDWREALREFIHAQCAGSDYSTWSRPNRRYFGEGFYMPSGVSQRVGELMVAVDTSGSIGGPELARFLGEVKGICDQVKPERVRLVYWDTAICADEVYEFDQLASLVTSTKPAGGGGTDASCIPAYIAAKGYTPQAVVVLTDGYVSGWGQWAHPVLWCVVGSKRVPPVGKAVYVE